MIQLYGLRMSNYYSLVKAVMIYKEVEFDEVKAPPTQKDDNLARSPMGKMPSIGVNGRYLSESVAIAQYLEQIAPEPALLPSDAFAAAKVMELVFHIKLDVELVARRCLGELLFNQPTSEETKESVKVDLERGMAALERILVASPYAAGDEITLADFYAFYSFGLASGIAHKVLGVNLLGDHPRMQSVIDKMAEHPAVVQVEAEKAA
ncbi:MAG: glutathione S-transferase family protein [Halioglobus sp.]